MVVGNVQPDDGRRPTREAASQRGITQDAPEVERRALDHQTLVRGNRRQDEHAAVGGTNAGVRVTIDRTLRQIDAARKELGEGLVFVEPFFELVERNPHLFSKPRNQQATRLPLHAPTEACADESPAR